MTPGPRWRELRLALAILTRLPVGSIVPCPPMGAAAWGFPVAGLATGLATGVTLWAALTLGLQPLAAAFVALTAGAFLTGGLHEDGLADLADGLSGGRSRDRRLEIMRDSRVGSHGALALVLAVGLRGSALAGLPPGWIIAGPVAAAMLARGLLPVLLYLLPPARPDGLGAEATRGLDGRRVAAGLALGLAPALALTGLAGLAAIAACGAAALVIARAARRHLGGHTGDVLGAAAIAGETAALLALSAQG